MCSGRVSSKAYQFQELQYKAEGLWTKHLTVDVSTRPCSVSRRSMCSPQTYVYHRTFPVLTYTLVTVRFWGVERDYIIDEITLSITNIGIVISLYLSFYLDDELEYTDEMSLRVFHFLTSYLKTVFALIAFLKHEYCLQSTSWELSLPPSVCGVA